MFTPIFIIRMSKFWKEYINGNNHALSKVYEPYFQPLVFVALKYVKDVDLAQDITSELFTKLLETDKTERKEKWSNINDVKAFLTTIVKCRALDHLKIQKNRNRILRENQILSEEYTDNKEQEFDHLKTCVEALPKEEQELVQLHLSGYKNHEIAETLNYSEKTIRNKLSTSRKNLIYLWKNLILVLLWNLL